MRAWISLSLILNALLLWRCWDARAKATSSLEPGKTSGLLQVSLAKEAAHLGNQVQPQSSAPEPDEASFQWVDVESADPAEFRDRLRAKGCPESLVRDLVGGRLRKRWTAQYRQIYPQFFRKEYWQTAGISLGSAADGAKAKQIYAELQAAHLRLLEIPLNQQGFVELLNLKIDSGMAALGWLPDDKRVAVKAKLAALESDNQHREDSGQTPSAGAEFEEQCAALKDLLTPAELTEYRLRHSPSLSMERENLKYLEPTRDELILIEQALAHGPAPSPAAKIKQVLTPERAAEYDVKSDPLWQVSQEATVRFGLPGETPAKMVTLRIEAEVQAQALRSDPSLTPSDRQAALTQLSAHAETQARNLLGEDGAIYLPRSRYWLDRLKSAVPPAP